jgi:hypothetical protein
MGSEAPFFRRNVASVLVCNQLYKYDDFDRRRPLCSHCEAHHAALLERPPNFVTLAPFADRKTIRGGDYGLAHAGVPRIVPGLAHNDEFAAGPMLREPPWRDERASEVQAAVNQDAGNRGS